MSNTQWLWQSTGGCERCDIMEDGNPYADEPPRPHPNCLCDAVEFTPTRDCIDEEYRYSVVVASENLDPVNNTLTYTFDYAIVCLANNSTLTGSVEVEREYDDWVNTPDDAMDLYLDELIADALEQVDDIAAAQCPPCPRMLLV